MKIIMKYILIVLIIMVLIIFCINSYVKISTRKLIIEDIDYSNVKDADCIIVLGAGIWGDKPSPMLEDRLLEAIKLYEDGLAPKIIMSGDHGKEEYDEVNVMKEFAISKNVPSEDIFMDHAGFSSYESIYRAKEIFGVERAIIVTQRYHLYRALYIAKRINVLSYGVAADPRKYVGETYREAREIIARNKDFVTCILKLKPKYLGHKIPITGNGDITND